MNKLAIELAPQDFHAHAQDRTLLFTTDHCNRGICRHWEDGLGDL